MAFTFEFFRVLRSCVHSTSFNVYVLLVISQMLTTTLSYQKMLCVCKVQDLNLYLRDDDLDNPDSKFSNLVAFSFLASLS